jgi:hypothetical protein
MANCPEEVALELSRAALESQDGSENQIREKATAVLSAASIVVPVAAVALGSAPAGAAIPFGVAALAYLWCARSCGSALFPKNRQAGLLGGEMLQLATDTGDLPQMQASAASYLDGFYKHNQMILEEPPIRFSRRSSRWASRSLRWLSPWSLQSSTRCRANRS